MRFLLALALLIFCSTAVVAQDLPDTTSELFELSELDYSVGALERIFGGIVSYVVDGDEAAAETGSLISSAVAILNIVVLGIATIVGLYSVLALTADTASDGTALGRSTDTKYTFLRAGIAAVFLLPVKGGFTVIQLIAIYLMVWGAGLADTTWKFVAEKTLSAESYVGPPNINNDEGWQMRGKIADATFALVNGELCALHLRRLSSSYGVNGGATLMSDEFTRDAVGQFALGSTRKYLELYYQSEAGSRNARDLCGNVRYSVSYSNTTFDNGLNPDELDDLQEKLSLIASENIYTTTRSALVNIVVPRSRRLANCIYSGLDSPVCSLTGADAKSGVRDDILVQNELKAIAEEATSAIFSSRVADTTFDDAEMTEIRDGLIGSVTKNGWMTAALWQRGLSNIFTQLRDIRNSLDVEVNTDNRIDNIFGTGVFSAIFSQNSVSRASFEPVERDFEYLGTFSSYIAKLHLPDPNGGSSSLGQGAGDDISGQYMNKIYVWLLSWFKPDGGEATFQDPFIGFAEVGSTMNAFGAGIYASAGAAQAVADGAGDTFVAKATGGSVATSVASFALEPVKRLGSYLFGIGIIFMILIPTIPMLYYLSASVTWLLLCIESMFALPLAVLLWFAPAREPSLIGPWHKVVLTMFGLLLRPFFAVVGLIVCVIILWIGNELLSLMFGGMLSVMSPGGSSVVLVLGLLGVYAMSLVFLAMHASSMIITLGDSAMGWIGVQMSPIARDGLGGEMAQSGKGQALGNAPSGGMIGAVRTDALANVGRAGGQKAIGAGNNIKGLLSKG